MSTQQDPSPATGDEGYLVDPRDWTESFAEAIAAREGLVLTEEHWSLTRWMRAWPEEHGISPRPRLAVAFLKERGGGRNRLFELFPYGYVKQACKIAGMMKPRIWSTG